MELTWNFNFQLLVGVIKQGVQCKDCRYNAHKKCAERVPNDCTGVLPSEANDGEASEESNDFEDRNGAESDEERHSPEVDDGSPIVTPSNFETHLAAQPTHSNIPVQRLVQSVKQVRTRVSVGHSVNEIFFCRQNELERRQSRRAGWCTSLTKTT